jgi:hypothetical protein
MIVSASRGFVTPPPAPLNRGADHPHASTVDGVRFLVDGSPGRAAFGRRWWLVSRAA